MWKMTKSNYYEVIDGTTMYYESYVKKLQEENAKLKETLKNNSKINIADHKFASKMEDKYLIEHNILTEFEKWLEERLDMTCGTDYNIYTQCLDKLQELKEGKNETNNNI